MSYAVVQQTLETPSTEQLKNAFRGVAGLTEIDALALGANALGILARGFELELATALKDSLVKEGVPAEVLNDASLPPLPETFALSRLDCTPEALLVYDSLGRVATLEWADVFMIAAGKVVVQEFTEIRTPWPQRMSEGGYKIIKHIDGHLAATDRRRVGGKHPHWEVQPMDITTKEEQHDRHLLEIFLAGGALRYSINADKSPQLFTHLGDRRTGNPSQDFLLVVQDLIKHAPHAALNRGAFFAQENAVAPFTYPGKIAFYNEIVWLLWQSSRSQPPAEEGS